MVRRRTNAQRSYKSMTTNKLPLDMVDEIISFAKEPRLNIAIYVNSVFPGRDLAFHITSQNKRIECRKHKDDQIPMVVKTYRNLFYRFHGVDYQEKYCDHFEEDEDICYDIVSYLGNDRPPDRYGWDEIKKLNLYDIEHLTVQTGLDDTYYKHQMEKLTDYVWNMMNMPPDENRNK